LRFRPLRERLHRLEKEAVYPMAQAGVEVLGSPEASLPVKCPTWPGEEVRLRS